MTTYRRRSRFSSPSWTAGRARRCYGTGGECWWLEQRALIFHRWLVMVTAFSLYSHHPMISDILDAIICTKIGSTTAVTNSIDWETRPAQEDLLHSAPFAARYFTFTVFSVHSLMEDGRGRRARIIEWTGRSESVAMTDRVHHIIIIGMMIIIIS